MGNTVSVWNAHRADIFTRADARRNKEKNLFIDDSYQCIEESAFRNNIKLRKLILDKNVSEIHKEAFRNCTAMKSIEMPGVRTIGPGAFEGCVKLGRAEMTDSIENVGRGAFMGCKRLEKIEINDDSRCRIIHADTFRDCQKLKSALLPAKISTIQDRAFYKCTELSELFFYKDLQEIGNSAFYNCGFKNLKLPQGLEKIGDSAFLKCRNLEYVKIPESVQVIDKWAFHGCDRLKVLEFTDDPEFVGDWIVNRSTVIRCQKGSKTDEYCRKFGFTVEYLSEV